MAISNPILMPSYYKNTTRPTQVIKRDGRVVDFDTGRIENALYKCFVSNSIGPSATVEDITERAVNILIARNGGFPPNVESIQDAVETALLSCGEYEAARLFIRYRDEHEKLRNERPIPEEVSLAFNQAKTYFPTPLQEFQFFDKYSRFNEQLGRRETWVETVDRAVDYLYELAGDRVSRAEYETIRRYILEMKAMPSMRLLAMAGAAARRQNLCIYNCAYLEADSVESFSEALLISMSGCGVGFSVESRAVDKLPRVERQKNKDNPVIVVEDTTEGWVDAVKSALWYMFEGYNPEIDYSLLRPAGAILRTKGGRSSGPEPLISAIEFARGRILSRQGSVLRPIDAHDIMCSIGNAAVSGGVRRTAMISLFDFNDYEMLHCKDGDFERDNSQRWNANNSAVWPEGGISQDQFIRQFMSMFDSQRGEPGIFNRQAAYDMSPERRKWISPPGCNPCQPGWATVLTPDGIRTFDDIEVGSVIWSGERWTQVVNKVATGEKPIFGFKTRAGTFYGTENHRVVSCGEKVEAKDAASIDVSTLHGGHGTTLIDSQIVLDGLVIGDGLFHKASNKIFLLIGKNDTDYMDHSELSSFIVKPRPGVTEEAWEVRTTITELPLTFDRRVPSKYLYGTRSQVCSFLRGLYSANGSVVNNRITLKAASRTLIEEVQFMLSFIGISSYYTVNKSHDVEFSNGIYHCKESYDLNIGNLPGREQFVEHIGFIQNYKQEKALSTCSVAPTKYKTTFDIVEIEELGTEQVYDITVAAEEHTYWTGGLLVSNCGEVYLHSMELCNLSIAVARAGDTLLDLQEKVRVAAIIGTIQSMATHFPGLRPQWKENCDRERLLGVDITGQLDCDATQDADIMKMLQAHVVNTNYGFAKRLGINQSAATTVCKPSGNSSQLLDCSSGIHARWAPFYIRNVRVSAHSPLFKVLRDASVPMSPENGQTVDNANTWVIHFVVKSPDGAVTRNNRSAVEQCEYWLHNKINWTEHNPSVTITYRTDEWIDLMKWVWDNREYVGGMAFLPSFDAKYAQLPYIEIDEDEYNELAAKFPVIDFSKIYRYEYEDYTTAAQELACLSGQCEI